MKLGIGKKIGLGYLPLVLVIGLIAVYAFVSLNAVYRLNKEIVETDMLLVEAADELQDHILAQESYGQRYLILRSEDMLERFEDRKRGFEAVISKINQLEKAGPVLLQDVDNLQAEYNRLYVTRIQLAGETNSDSTAVLDQDIKRILDATIAAIHEFSKEVKKNQGRKAHRTARIGKKALQWMVLFSGVGLLLALGAALAIARSVGQAVRKLKKATRQISEGQYESVPDLTSGDELQELAVDLKEMARRLARLEEMHLDASPLTRLPGGVAIENVLKKRLSTQNPVAFCLLDLDNFKAFNDRYGYASGNEVIKVAAGIVRDAVAHNGNKDDFVGHIGGDDFSVVTTPDRYEAICDEVVKVFDERIGSFYEANDLENGFIISNTRQGKKTKFPIMSVSIAVVTNNKRKDISHIEMGEIAAELKKFVKSKSGSLHMLDRRFRKA